MNKIFSEFVRNVNDNKRMFTPGPAALLNENLEGLRPCFGRGDVDYEKVEAKVLTWLKSLSGQPNIVRFQGSGALAVEIAIRNFVAGRALVVDTGFYSTRMVSILRTMRDAGHEVEVSIVSLDELHTLNESYDWILCSYVETSIALKVPLNWLTAAQNATGARILLDATASIGLEHGHECADVVTFSSCKGLFGLTGAAFIAFKEKWKNEEPSFYLNLETHFEQRVTGPYHSICSLLKVSETYDKFQRRVIKSKSTFMSLLDKNDTLDDKFQPLLCTYFSGRVFENKKNAVFYSPRINIKGSIICHIGFIDLSEETIGTTSQKYFNLGKN